MKLLCELYEVGVYKEEGELYINVKDIPKITTKVTNAIRKVVEEENSVKTALIPVNTKPIRSGKNKTPSQLAYEKSQDPNFVAMVEGFRNKFDIYKKNKYLKYFFAHKEFFYRTLAYRLALGDISREAIEHSFSLMENEQDFSILDFLNNIPNQQYTNKEKLMDFIFIMLDGVVTFNKERKAINELLPLIETSTIKLTDIEDCWYWMHEKSGMGFGMSLTSVPNALAHFQKYKKQQPNGRFEGTAAGGFTTKDEKSLENLERRDYNNGAGQATEHINRLAGRFKIKGR